MKEEKNATVDISDKHYARLFEKYRKQKDIYANAGNDSKGREIKALITKQIQKDKSDIDRSLRLKDHIASTTSNPRKFGHNPVGKLGKYASFIADVVTGNSELTTKDKRAGYYTINGEFMPLEKIEEELINENKIDEAAKEGIMAIIENSMRKAQQVNPGENSDFNYQKEFNNIYNKIISQGNLKSLSTDKIFGNRIFKDDLEKTIMTSSYEELGISLTREKAEKLDPTKEDNLITKDDAKVITKRLMSDSETLKKYLSEYYTNAIEQNFYNNLKPEVQSLRTQKLTQQNTNNISTKYYKPQQ